MTQNELSANMAIKKAGIFTNTGKCNQFQVKKMKKIKL